MTKHPTKRARGPLTVALALFVAGYHATNLVRGEWFQPGSGWHDSRLRWMVAGSDWINVTLPAHYEPAGDAIDAGSDALRSLGYRLQYRLGRLPEFVIAGRPDPFRRLYLRDEIYVQFPEAAEVVREGFGKLAPPYVKALEAAGVTVLVLPVPTKIAIEREWLPPILPAESLWSQGRMPAAMRFSPENPAAAYRPYVDLLPDNVVDLYSLYAEYHRLHPDEDLFLPAGTHWTSRGITLAASAVIDRLRARGWKLGRPEIKYENRFTPDYSADLLRALLLPAAFVESLPEFQWWEPVYRIPPVTGGRDNGRVIVAGSCYSRRLADTFGLGETLAYALGRIHIDSSFDFSPAVDPLKRLVEDGIALQSGDLLIWEFASRRPPQSNGPIPIPAFVGGAEVGGVERKVLSQ